MTPNYNIVQLLNYHYRWFQCKHCQGIFIVGTKKYTLGEEQVARLEHQQHCTSKG